MTSPRRPADTPRPIDSLCKSKTTENTADLRRWWADFNDSTLSSLIERSISANLDLRAAVLRIEEARAQRGVTAAALWPSLSTNASYASTRLSETTATGSLFTTPGIGIPNPYNQYQLGVDASWELDLFGRIRRSVEVADANIEVSVEDQHAVEEINQLYTFWFKPSIFGLVVLTKFISSSLKLVIPSSPTPYPPRCWQIYHCLTALIRPSQVRLSFSCPHFIQGSMLRLTE
jgi:hypothetical protein